MVSILVFIILVIGTPIVIFFSARKVAEWIIAVLLLFALVFYYADMLTQFLTDHDFWNALVSLIITLLQNYKMFILNHWPQFGGISVFGISMNVDYGFTATWVPLIILYAGGLIRYVVVRFVPHYRLREVTREYWLYITSFLIILLIISSVLDWNILILLLIFLLTLLVISAGLWRILTDPLVVVFHAVLHLLRWIWIGMKYLASIAADIAKFLYHLFKNIRELYNKYVRQPFIQLDQKIQALEANEEQRVDEKLKRKNF